MTEKYDMSGVSVIVSAYEVEDFIGECLISIQNQNYFNKNKNYEIIVGVDGCEKTLFTVKKLRSEIENLRILWMENNMGSFPTLNSLISETKFGHIIKFDSDDIMKPNLVESVMENNHGYDIIRFAYESFDDNIEKSYFVRHHHMGNVYYKKTLFDLCGGYADLRFSGDLELLIRTNDFVDTLNLNKPLFYYRNHSNNLTNSVDMKDRLGVNKKIKSNNYTKQNIKLKPTYNYYVEV